MTTRSGWSRQELLVAFSLYCRIPFGRISSRNPDIVRYSKAIGRTPAALSMKLGNIASLDPAITSTGRVGLRGASANDLLMWEEMQGDWERFAIESEQVMSEVQAKEGLDRETSQDDISDRVGEDRIRQTTTRIGQNFFRNAVLSAYNGKCCITGLSFPSLLVASHIVPWSHSRGNRVNPRNGLLLSVLHDKAFDAGIITVRDDMTVQVAFKHKVGDDRFFSESIAYYDGQSITLPEKFTPDKEFLSYHREHIFQN